MFCGVSAAFLLGRCHQTGLLMPLGWIKFVVITVPFYADIAVRVNRENVWGRQIAFPRACVIWRVLFSFGWLPAPDPGKHPAKGGIGDAIFLLRDLLIPQQVPFLWIGVKGGLSRPDQRLGLKLPAAHEALPSGRTCRECVRYSSSKTVEDLGLRDWGRQLVSLKGFAHYRTKEKLLSFQRGQS